MLKYTRTILFYLIIELFTKINNFLKKQPQAPPPSNDKVVFSDILRFPPKQEQHLPSYDDIE